MLMPPALSTAVEAGARTWGTSPELMVTRRRWPGSSTASVLKISIAIVSLSPGTIRSRLSSVNGWNGATGSPFGAYVVRIGSSARRDWISQPAVI